MELFYDLSNPSGISSFEMMSTLLIAANDAVEEVLKATDCKVKQQQYVNKGACYIPCKTQTIHQKFFCKICEELLFIKISPDQNSMLYSSTLVISSSIQTMGTLL